MANVTLNAILTGIAMYVMLYGFSALMYLLMAP